MTSSRYVPQPYVKLKHPEWTKNATIYQINTRQFTKEGTFREAEKHLDRLRALGVDILWLMPIHEIGIINRKGTLGSPYSVRDYYSVNSEFGSLDDLKHFVASAHAQGMHVILDWVANHTAWDNPLVSTHPDWYVRDWKGDFRPTPWWDWPDIIDLDYTRPEVRQYMTEALKYWVSEADVDGYRCDVAGFVPTDFWNNARKELDMIKPVFMLAEWESRDLHAEAFDMTYAWTWFDAVKAASCGGGLDGLFVYYSWNEKAYAQDCFRMTMVSNHDKNAWDGTEYEQFGEAVEAAIVLSVVGEGFPLLYNGQEAGNTRRLAFFEKDPIDWQPHPMGELYQRLFAIKKQNHALWNGAWGARMVHVPNRAPSAVFSFVRQTSHNKVLAAINFSRSQQSPTFAPGLCDGEYRDAMTGEEMTLTGDTAVTIEPWGYRIFISP